MTNKPINRKNRVVLSAESFHSITSSTPPKKSSQVVKKELNLEKQVILLLEAFLVHNKSNKIFPIMLFLQNNNPEQYFKKYFQRKLVIKISKELKIS